MKLREIYKPIEKDLRELERLLSSTFAKGDKVSSKISRFAVCAPGKRLRPTLVFLSSNIGKKRKIDIYKEYGM